MDIKKEARVPLSNPTNMEEIVSRRVKPFLEMNILLGSLTNLIIFKSTLGSKTRRCRSSGFSRRNSFTATPFFSLQKSTSLFSPSSELNGSRHSFPHHIWLLLQNGGLQRVSEPSQCPIVWLRKSLSSLLSLRFRGTLHSYASETPCVRRSFD